jgi:MFS family permease
VVISDLPAQSRKTSVGLTAAAGALGTLFMGATLPTPLYPLYGAAFGFGKTTLTLVYATYVLGNLIALLFLGRLSDQIGRRTITGLAIGLGIASTLLFLFAREISWLFAARAVSGLATGLGAGAATAWIAELQPGADRAAAASLASAANLAGLAVAPLLAGVFAQFLPHALRLPYIAYLALLVASGAAVLTASETVRQRVRQLAELRLRPQLGVPRQSRLAFVAPAVTAFATFALIGFYAALIPSLLRDSLAQPSALVAGLVVFELFGVAAAVAAVTSRVAVHAAMLTGLALLPPQFGNAGSGAAAAIHASAARRCSDCGRSFRVGLSRQPRSGESNSAERATRRGGIKLPDIGLSRKFRTGHGYWVPFRMGRLSGSQYCLCRRDRGPCDGRAGRRIGDRRAQPASPERVTRQAAT